MKFALTGILACIFAVSLASCTSSEPQPQTEETSSVQPITSTEFVRWIGEPSIHLEVYNGLDEKLVLQLNAHPARNNVITTAINEQGHLFVVDADQIVWRTAWKDGLYMVHLPSLTPRSWLVRYNLAVLNGKVIGTVGEVNHGQDAATVGPDWSNQEGR